MTVVDWVDLFTRAEHKLQIVESLRYCQQAKGLRLFAWCLMPSHRHLIAAPHESHHLSDFLRDFKKFTGKALIQHIQTEPESRREWLLHRFAHEAERHQRGTHYKVWQDGNHAEQLLTENPSPARSSTTSTKTPSRTSPSPSPSSTFSAPPPATFGLPGLLGVEFLL